MSYIVTSLFSALISFLLGMVGEIMEFLINIFQNGFTTSPDLFTNLFGVEGLESAFMIIGLTLTFSLLLFGVFRNMFSGLGFAGDKPFQMVLMFFIAIFFTFFLKDGLLWIYGDGENGFFALIFKQIGDIRNTTIGAFSAPSASSFTGTGAENVGTVALLLICLVLIISVLWNFLKLLLEMVERYLLLNTLIFFSPLVGSTVTLSTTLKVFSSYLKMYCGQLLLILLNSVTLKIFLRGYDVVLCLVGGAGGEVVGEGNSAVLARKVAEIFDGKTAIAMFFGFLALIGFLKIAQRFDNYMRDIGLTVGLTGGNLLDDIMVSAKTVSSGVKNFSKSHGSSSSETMGGSSTGTGNGLFSGSGKATALGVAGKVLKTTALMTPVGGAMYAAKSLMQAKAQDGEITPEGFKRNFFKPATDFGNSVGNFAKSKIGNLGFGQDYKNQTNGMATKFAITGEQAGRMANNYLGSENYQALGLNTAESLKVGTGGTLFKDQSGDLNFVTDQKPANGSYQEFTATDGSTMYSQNLSAVNRECVQETGQDYTAYTQAEAVYSTGSSDYSGIRSAVGNSKAHYDGIDNFVSSVDTGGTFTVDWGRKMSSKQYNQAVSVASNIQNRATGMPNITADINKILGGSNMSFEQKMSAMNELSDTVDIHNTVREFHG